MSWLADRRTRRLVDETEQRLRWLLEGAGIFISPGDGCSLVLPGAFVAALGSMKVHAVLAEYGLSPARPESSLEGQSNGGALRQQPPPGHGGTSSVTPQNPTAQGRP